MKSKTNKISISLDKKIKSFTADNGEVFNITQEELQQRVDAFVENIINEHHKQSTASAKRLDTIHKFETFQVDDKVIKGKYDESDKESYNHFIHKYLRDFYVDGNRSYDPLTLKHERLLNGKKHDIELDVRDSIMANNLKPTKTAEELKDLLRFMLDSKMVDVNERIMFKYKMKYSTDSYNTSVPAFIIKKCYYLTDGKELEVLQWVYDEYGMDLTKIDTELDENSYEIWFLNNRVSLMPFIINTIHNYRIHETYNNGISCRKYHFDGRPKDPSKTWEQKSFDKFVRIISFLVDKHPNLKYQVKYKSETQNFNDVYNYLKYYYLSDDGIYRPYSRESADELLECFEKYSTSLPEARLEDSLNYMIEQMSK
jgi:hypothetical protein